MKTFYSKKYFQKWLQDSPPVIQDWFRKEENLLRKRIKLHSKILDVGCGFGRHVGLLHPNAKEIIGIDSNQDMVSSAKSDFINCRNVKFFRMDAIKLKFPNNYFDYVICMTNTFGNFLQKKKQALKEMKRVAKQTGLIFISVYSNRALRIRKRSYQEVGLHIVRTTKGRVYTREGLVSEGFTKDELEKLFDQVELIHKIEQLNRISYLCKLTKS